MTPELSGAPVVDKSIQREQNLQDITSQVTQALHPSHELAGPPNRIFIQDTSPEAPEYTVDQIKGITAIQLDNGKGEKTDLVTFLRSHTQDIAQQLLSADELSAFTPPAGKTEFTPKQRIELMNKLLDKSGSADFNNVLKKYGIRFDKPAANEPVSRIAAMQAAIVAEAQAVARELTAPKKELLPADDSRRQMYTEGRYRTDGIILEGSKEKAGVTIKDELVAAQQLVNSLVPAEVAVELAQARQNQDFAKEKQLRQAIYESVLGAFNVSTADTNFSESATNKELTKKILERYNQPVELIDYQGNKIQAKRWELHAADANKLATQEFVQTLTKRKFTPEQWQSEWKKFSTLAESIREKRGTNTDPSQLEKEMIDAVGSQFTNGNEQQSRLLTQVLSDRLNTENRLLGTHLQKQTGILTQNLLLTELRMGGLEGIELLLRRTELNPSENTDTPLPAELQSPKIKYMVEKTVVPPDMQPLMKKLAERGSSPGDTLKDIAKPGTMEPTEPEPSVEHEHLDKTPPHLTLLDLAMGEASQADQAHDAESAEAPAPEAVVTEVPTDDQTVLHEEEKEALPASGSHLAEEVVTPEAPVTLSPSTEDLTSVERSETDQSHADSSIEDDTETEQDAAHAGLPDESLDEVAGPEVKHEKADSSGTEPTTNPPDNNSVNEAASAVESPVDPEADYQNSLDTLTKAREDYKNSTEEDRQAKAQEYQDAQAQLRDAWWTLHKDEIKDAIQNAQVEKKWEEWSQNIIRFGEKAKFDDGNTFLMLHGIYSLRNKTANPQALDEVYDDYKKVVEVITGGTVYDESNLLGKKLEEVESVLEDFDIKRAQELGPEAQIVNVRTIGIVPETLPSGIPEINKYKLPPQVDFEVSTLQVKTEVVVNPTDISTTETVTPPNQISYTEAQNQLLSSRAAYDQARATNEPIDVQNQKNSEYREAQTRAFRSWVDEKRDEFQTAFQNLNGDTSTREQIGKALAPILTASTYRPDVVQNSLKTIRQTLNSLNGSPNRQPLESIYNEIKGLYANTTGSQIVEIADSEGNVELSFGGTNNKVNNAPTFSQIQQNGEIHEQPAADTVEAQAAQTIGTHLVTGEAQASENGATPHITESNGAGHRPPPGEPPVAPEPLPEPERERAGQAASPPTAEPAGPARVEAPVEQTQPRAEAQAVLEVPATPFEAAKASVLKAREEYIQSVTNPKLAESREDAYRAAQDVALTSWKAENLARIQGLIQGMKQNRPDMKPVTAHLDKWLLKVRATYKLKGRRDAVQLNLKDLYRHVYKETTPEQRADIPQLEEVYSSVRDFVESVAGYEVQEYEDKGIRKIQTINVVEERKREMLAAQTQPEQIEEAETQVEVPAIPEPEYLAAQKNLHAKRESLREAQAKHTLGEINDDELLKINSEYDEAQSQTFMAWRKANASQMTALLKQMRERHTGLTEDSDLKDAYSDIIDGLEYLSEGDYNEQQALLAFAHLYTGTLPHVSEQVNTLSDFQDFFKNVKNSLGEISYLNLEAFGKTPNQAFIDGDLTKDEWKKLKAKGVDRIHIADFEAVLEDDFPTEAEEFEDLQDNSHTKREEFGTVWESKGELAKIRGHENREAFRAWRERTFRHARKLINELKDNSEVVLGLPNVAGELIGKSIPAANESLQELGDKLDDVVEHALRNMGVHYDTFETATVKSLGDYLRASIRAGLGASAWTADRLIPVEDIIRNILETRAKTIQYRAERKGGKITREEMSLAELKALEEAFRTEENNNPDMAEYYRKRHDEQSQITENRITKLSEQRDELMQRAHEKRVQAGKISLVRNLARLLRETQV